MVYGYAFFLTLSFAVAYTMAGVIYRAMHDYHQKRINPWPRLLPAISIIYLMGFALGLSF